MSRHIVNEENIIVGYMGDVGYIVRDGKNLIAISYNYDKSMIVWRSPWRTIPLPELSKLLTTNEIVDLVERHKYVLYKMNNTKPDMLCFWTNKIYPGRFPDLTEEDNKIQFYDCGNSADYITSLWGAKTEDLESYNIPWKNLYEKHGVFHCFTDIFTTNSYI